jgi:hypothetical protein
VRYTSVVAEEPNVRSGHVPNPMSGRLSWLVLLDNVDAPISRPAGSSPDAPTSERTTVAVFIDAKSGEFLGGGTLNDYARGEA